MAAQVGRSMLLKVGDGGGTEVFTTAAGLRTKSFKMNNAAVDITNSDSTNQWRQLLANAGVKSFTVSGSGVFQDAAVDETIRSLFIAGTIRNWQVIIPDFGTFKGLCQIVDLSFDANYDGEQTFSITLESAGEPTWTAA